MSDLNPMPRVRNALFYGAVVAGAIYYLSPDDETDSEVNSNAIIFNIDKLRAVQQGLQNVISNACGTGCKVHECT